MMFTFGDPPPPLRARHLDSVICGHTEEVVAINLRVCNQGAREATPLSESHAMKSAETNVHVAHGHHE